MSAIVKLAREKRIKRNRAKYSNELLIEVSQKAFDYAVQLNKENFYQKSWWRSFFKNCKPTM